MELNGFHLKLVSASKGRKIRGDVVLTPVDSEYMRKTVSRNINDGTITIPRVTHD